MRVTTKTRVGLTTTAAAVSVRSYNLDTLSADVSNPATPLTRARPYGARGAELEITIRNAADTADELTYSEFATKPLAVLAIDAAYRNRVKKVRVRWLF